MASNADADDDAAIAELEEAAQRLASFVHWLHESPSYVSSHTAKLAILANGLEEIINIIADELEESK